MIGAEALLRTLVGSDVDVCFANPGTSEMHFVAALDRVPEMRAVLTLFEGVATGAADGYARMSGRPAATLLHLGPGLANGWANLHNARRAGVPLVNVVGDHATYHQRFDSRLQSDLWGLARSISAWQRSTTRPEDVGEDAADAVCASYGPPGRIATLIVPADVSWSEGGAPAPRRTPPPLPLVPPATIDGVAKVLGSGARSVLLIGGAAMRERGLAAADRIAHAAGAKLLCETFPTVHARGGGLPDVEKLAYYGEAAMAQLEGAQHLVLAGSRAPAAFFAYPDKPSALVPAGVEVHQLSPPAHDVTAALEARQTHSGRAGRPTAWLRHHNHPRSGRRADSPPRPWPRRSATCCRRGRSSSTNRSRAGCGSRQRPPAGLATIGSRSPEARSVRGCRRPPAPQSRRRDGGC